MKKCLLIAAMLVLASVVYAQNETAKEPEAVDQWEEVSLIQLISAPQAYEGKKVLVIGFVNLEFEGNAVYLSEGDYKHRISKNGLWIDANDDIWNNAEKFNKHYCLIVGVVDSAHKGHMNSFSGGIKNITRFELWGERKD